MTNDDAGSVADRLEAYLDEYDRSGVLLDVEDDETMPSEGVAEGSVRVGDLRRAVAALRGRDAEVDRLRRERNAYMIGVICNALDADDDLVEEMLGDPRKLSECGDQFIRMTESSAFAKYLDLPSDLGATAPPLPRGNAADPAD